MTIIKQQKKIAILVGDGMADYPIKELGGKTPLEFAKTPHMDFIAKNGLLGLTKTVPEGMNPGSDTANLSIFGCNPRYYYTGRAPLEALNMGIKLGNQDVAYRCNLVTIDDDGRMVDFSANHIESEFTKAVIDELKKNITDKDIEFYAGVSYRNIMVWRDYPYEKITDTTPPHDIQDEKIASHLPNGDGSERLIKIMNASKEIIKNSKVLNHIKHRYKGDPASAWLWGAGRSPSMKPLKERFGITGHTISAVDLINGIGKAAGLTPIHVDGITGYLDTNYAGKADTLIEALKKFQFRISSRRIAG